MKASVVITEKEFKNKFDNVLLDNPTIHKILSKESNLGFTTQLVLDQLKAELTESIFASEEEEPIEESTSEEKEDNLETTDPEEEETAEDGLDDLDELD